MAQAKQYFAAFNPSNIFAILQVYILVLPYLKQNYINKTFFKYFLTNQ
jgi:hypothetical protein